MHRLFIIDEEEEEQEIPLELPFPEVCESESTESDDVDENEELPFSEYVYAANPTVAILKSLYSGSVKVVSFSSYRCYHSVSDSLLFMGNIDDGYYELFDKHVLCLSIDDGFLNLYVD